MSAAPFSVVIPTYKNEDNMGGLVFRLSRTAVGTFDALVDDGSK